MKKGITYIILIFSIVFNIYAEKIVYNKSTGKITTIETDYAYVTEDEVINGTYDVYKPDWSNEVFSIASNIYIYNNHNVKIGSKTNISQVTDLYKVWPLTEDEKQFRKPFMLKVLENQFMVIIYSLGFTNKVDTGILGSTILNTIASTNNTQEAKNQAITKGLLLLSVDSDAKRYNPLWYDTAIFHSEVDL